MIRELVWVGIGGAGGSMVRYAVGRGLAQFPWSDGFPWATFAVNVAGSAILGALAAQLVIRQDGPGIGWYLLLGTGFCGGLTTFSTFAFDAVMLMREQRTAVAFVYLLGSVAAGLTAFAAAFFGLLGKT